MRTEKVPLTLEEELLAEARAAVGARSLSSYVNHALRQQLQRDRLTVLLADLERENGPIDPQVMGEVRLEWPESEERAATRRSA